MQDEPRQGGWLPPDPGEPPAGTDPAPPPQPPTQEQPTEQQPPPGWQQGPPPPGWQQPPPGWYPPPQPPPGYWWPQQQWQQPWEDPNDPGNTNAIVSFVLALSGLGLLLILFGISAPLTLVCGGLAIWFGVKGRRAVDSGETKKHRGLAQAGFWIGIATVVLSILAIIAWVALLTLDDNFLDELEEDNPNFDEFDSVRAAITAVKLGVRLLG